MASTADHARAFGLAGFDVAHHGLQLRGVNQGAHHGVGVEGVGRLVLGRLGGDHLDEAIGNGLVDQHTRRRVAALALVEEHTAGDGLGGALEVGEVVENQYGRFATELVKDTLEVAASSVVQHAPANTGRTREPDGVDIHVQREGFASLVAMPGDDVEDAWRQTRLNRQFGQAQGGQWALFAWL